MRIGIPLLGSQDWLGGVNYIRNLIYAVKMADPKTQIVWAGQGDPSIFGDEIKNAKQVPYPKPLKLTPTWWVKKFFTEVTGLGARWFYKELLDSTDVLYCFYSKALIRNKPSIGWLFDFQHVLLPEQFEPHERRRRDEEFKIISEKCTCVVLSSEDAAAHFRRLFPKYAHKANVFRFVPKLRYIPTPEDGVRVREKYKLPEKFFYFPSQLWRHKNHLTVLRALALLRSRGQSVNVVFSGRMEDYRWPKHAQEVKTFVQSQKLEDCTFFLGLIEEKDLTCLMYESVAVLNPSLFEGWSTVVEESKALDVPILLSNLEVHREQAPKKGKLIPALHIEDWANAMWSYSQAARNSSPPSAKELQSKNDKDLKEAGETFLLICQRAINEFERSYHL